MTEEDIDEPNHGLSFLLGLIGVCVLAFGGVGWYEDGFSSPNLYLTVGGLGLLALGVLLAIRAQRKFKRGEKHSGKLESVASGISVWGLVLLFIWKLIKYFFTD